MIFEIDTALKRWKRIVCEGGICLSYKISESLLTDYCEENHEDCVKDYIEKYQKFLDSLPLSRQRQELISHYNRMHRSKFTRDVDVDLKVRVGDICYLDYGCAYKLECAYQHMGLVLHEFLGKLFIIPLTSNPKAVANSRLGKKRHLYYLGQLPGLQRSSCLFLNDGKYLNPARIIHICSHLDPNSEKFKNISKFYGRLFNQ